MPCSSLELYMGSTQYIPDQIRLRRPDYATADWSLAASFEEKLQRPLWAFKGLCTLIYGRWSKVLFPKWRKLTWAPVLSPDLNYNIGTHNDYSHLKTICIWVPTFWLILWGWPSILTAAKSLECNALWFLCQEGGSK